MVSEKERKKRQPKEEGETVFCKSTSRALTTFFTTKSKYIKDGSISVSELNP